MDSAPPSAERSATVRQQIESHLAVSDLESVKQIAETDKDYFPKDFIAQCLRTLPSPYYHDYDLQEAWRLFLDTFIWFVEEFGPTSPGYFGLGKSKEEVIDLQDDLAPLREFFKIIWSISDIVLHDLNLVVAKS